MTTTPDRPHAGRHRLRAGVGACALVVAVVLTAACSSGGGGGDDSADDAVRVSPAESASANGVAAGDHVVGTDLDPGQYRARVTPSTLALCTVTQTDDDGVLDMRSAGEGSVIFTVQDVPGSVVSFDGCTSVVPTAEVPGTPPGVLGAGDWLVGPELAAGRYAATVDTDTSIVLGVITQTDGADILDTTSGDTGTVVLTVQDVPGSVVSFSGVTDIHKVG
ncbi:hypothetical protein Cch01nite_29800 [Cellulomonas chitinilytica]|uniref:Uncharacterized protein n=1 Tax=Cellulomonas chitinilytica TaxID=398759 RepID=A0A919P2L2_9CELL|nr:hypothetical protein [Cellulomonas chitinilytica]GIG22256.1 hypothetical protein Cch01nite_29800 [Cellulomonas chitinilytica]